MDCLPHLSALNVALLCFRMFVKAVSDTTWQNSEHSSERTTDSRFCHSVLLSRTLLPEL